MMLKWKLSWLMILSLLEVKTTSNPSPKSEDIMDYLPSLSSLASWSTSEFLQNTLSYEDYADGVILLNNQQQSSYNIEKGKGIKLVFPLRRASPLRIALSPCWGQMEWTFSYRTPSFFQVEVITAKPDEEPSSVDFNYRSSLYRPIRDNSAPEEKSILRKRRAGIPRLGRGRRIYKSTIVKKNFSSVMVEHPKVFSYSKRRRSYEGVELSYGEGMDPWVFQNRLAQPGLYIIRIKGISPTSKFDILASKDFFPLDETGVIKAYTKKNQGSENSITLKWSGRRISESSACLVISRKKLYHSFCAAQGTRSRMIETNFTDDSMIIGCTSESQYTLPVTNSKLYYVSVWDSRSLIPFAQANVKANPRRRMPRLRPGMMVAFTLNAGGSVKARFNMRKTGRKLHVAAVSCVGGVEVCVSNGKHRVASAKGREALHLTVKQVPKSLLTIKVSPENFSLTLYKVYLVVTHSARRLPVPRLPKDVTVGAKPLDCTSILVDWGKAPGGATYCIALRTHPNGRPPEIRPPLQCGWEHAIKQKDYFEVLRCFPPQKAKRQTYVLSDLSPESSFIVNVLVRHPVTGRTLALQPAIITLPSCTSHGNFIDDS